MVKRSKKSKSKRVPLRKKYKILKKVKEHHKKKAKEAKKLGKLGKRRVEKDPGIPNDWPFKEQELQALEARRVRAIEELEQKKQLKKERAQKRKLGLLEEDGDLKQLVNSISNREKYFLKGKSSAVEALRVGTVHDGSERAFYKELMKVIEASDVILEVLDARDPLGTRCLDMERMVLKAGPEKHLVLLLNKIDLVPREIAEKWLKYLREELPTIAFKCNTQEQRSNLGRKSALKLSEHSPRMQISNCLGAETLIRLLKNYSRSYELKKSITVGIVGLPNVGKSSLINSMKRAHVVNVGATPGLTRVMQEIQLDKHVKLLDCPGVVMAKAGDNEVAIALRNCKRIEKLEDPISPDANLSEGFQYSVSSGLTSQSACAKLTLKLLKEILRLCPAEKLMSLYKLPSFSLVDDFLQKVASVRGKLKKGGVADTVAAARIVLHDWNEGKIPYFTSPPTRNEGEHLESAIVSAWGKEFDVNDIYREESSVIGNLPSMIDSTHVEMPANSPLNMDGHLFESEEEEAMEEGNEAPVNSDVVGMDTREIVVTNSQRSESQNDKLYDAEGIFNPHSSKAEKKRRKKGGRLPKEVSNETEVDDYDFATDYKKQSAILEKQDEPDKGDGDENMVKDGNNLDSTPMTGVELDA